MAEAINPGYPLLTCPQLTMVGTPHPNPSPVRTHLRTGINSIVLNFLNVFSRQSSNQTGHNRSFIILQLVTGPLQLSQQYEEAFIRWLLCSSHGDVARWKCGGRLTENIDYARLYRMKKYYYEGKCE